MQQYVLRVLVPCVRKEYAGLGVEIAHSIDELLDSVDALMMLRVQRERLGRAMLPSVEEYALYTTSIWRDCENANLIA